MRDEDAVRKHAGGYKLRVQEGNAYTRLTQEAATDNDLIRVVEAWPTLPDAIRQAVLKLIS
jgi:hypothetical protein